ncbi:MAG TPA: EAL domain-containing protein [Beijerinckiaceae bacterium]|mgnify:CR=1 FL=1|nr:EAL domain-containing protein [Beijerinckiaceae bacterium]
MDALKNPGSRTLSTSLSVVPILLVSFAVIGSMSFLAKTAFERNERQAILTEQRRIDMALEHEASEFADQIQREALLLAQPESGKPIDMERLSTYLASEHRLDFVAVYSRAGKLISIRSSRPEILERRLKASDELIAERETLKTPFALRRIGMSSTLVEPRAIISMAAVNVGDQFQLVVARRLEDRTLTAIGKLLLLADLRFAETDLTSPASPETGMTLVWNRINDGSFNLQSLASIGFMGIAVIGIYGLLVYLHIRRVTRELEQSEAQAQHQAGHDPLSGLPNRSLFHRALNTELARVNRDGGGLAVMYLDLDKFKEVNDQFGHEIGDKLIIQVAGRLGQLVRGADTVARFGGDEFAIIQVGVRTIDDVETLARRVLDELRRPFRIDDFEVNIGCSIGVSVAPENGNDSVQLMRYADIALYRAKNEGRNRYSFFEHQMNETMRLKKIIEDDLRAAIDNERLVLHYQPIVTADGSQIIGLEALVRWNHPESGLIPPNEFISIAEERGLISALGEWVLRRACLDTKHWPGVSVSVNVSPVQFRQRDFVATVARILAETGFDPHRLELELTEGVVVEDADQAEAAIMDLRAMGVRIALDDFGVGYSSLIYLRRFAFDRIKIDKSFLESMEGTGESAILIHSIVHLGRALGLEVTAEGVETEEQQRFLQAVGCHHLQGYYFARPCPAAEIAGVLEKAQAMPNEGRLADKPNPASPRAAA